MTVIAYNWNLPIPHRGEVYRHYKGDFYVVVGVGSMSINPTNDFICTAIVEATLEEVHIFRNPNRSLCILGKAQKDLFLNNQLFVVYTRMGQFWVRTLFSFFEEAASGQKRFTLMVR